MIVAAIIIIAHLRLLQNIRRLQGQCFAVYGISLHGYGYGGGDEAFGAGRQQAAGSRAGLCVRHDDGGQR